MMNDTHTSQYLKNERMCDLDDRSAQARNLAARPNSLYTHMHGYITTYIPSYIHTYRCVGGYPVHVPILNLLCSQAVFLPTYICVHTYLRT